SDLHDHTAEDRCAYGVASVFSGAAGGDQRDNAEDEGEGSHENRAQADAGSFYGRVDNGHAAFAQLLGEFHDQDGVLGGEAYEHDESHLAVDIVLLAAEPLGGKRTEQRHGHGEQNNEGEHEAFILRRERQINDQRSQSEKDERGRSRDQLFERNSRPFVGVALGQNFRGELLHGVDGLSGTEAGGSGAVDFRGAEKIVVADDLGRSGLGNGD